MQRAWLQFAAFSVIVAVVAIFLGLKVLSLRLLYTDAASRNFARESIVSTAEARGWIASDIDILSLQKNEIVLRHRDHFRGSSALECVKIDLVTSTSVSCDAY